MTVQTTAARVQYTGNGVTTAFATSFKFIAATDLVVTLTNTTTGVDTAQTLNTHYTVTGAGVATGGTVTFITPPAASQRVTIERVTTPTQELDYVPNDPFPAESHESGLDKLTMLIQENQVSNNRVLRLGAGDLPTTLNALPSQSARASRLLGFAATGQPMAGPLIANIDAAIAAYLGGVSIGEISSVGDHEALEALTGMLDRQVIFMVGYHTGSRVGGGYFQFVAGSSATVDDGLVFTAVGGRWFRVLHQDWLPAAAFGFKTDGSLNDTAMTNFLASTLRELVFQSGSTYTFGARINITVNNKRLRADGPDYAYFNFPGVLGVSSGTAHLIYGTGRSNVSLEGISAAGDATSFVNNGFDTYGILFTSSSNIHLKRVRATGVENGVIFGSGMSDSSMEDVVGYNCYYHSVGSWGTSGNPNRRLTLKNLRGYSNQSVEHLAPVSGVYVEETYDSHLENLTGHDSILGVRIENSCDNTIIGVQGYENWSSGAELYNVAQRNTCTGVRVWNNNRGNRDAIDTTTRGNDNTKCSGLNIEGTSDNNVGVGVIAFQTKATLIPFNSGSVEPWLGSMLQGATSNKLGRVRRIVVTSGTWGGGDAAGVFHVVENNGAFNASEIIKNVTSRVPYNSGSDKPRAGDTLTGATSGASGTVLWVSQQSGAAGDWSLGNSDGYIYLTGVTGTFNASENLNNTTLSQNNIATTNGAATAAAADIATTNGATTLGRANSDGTYGRGFQKYGIGINIRNLPTVNDGDSYNVLTGVQCFNNDVAQISDRGYMNVIEAMNELNVSLIRSA